MVTETSLLESIVYHKRHTPAIHSFAHKVFFLALNLKAKPKTKFFSINRLNLFSLYLKDYGFKKITDPRLYLDEALQEFKINPKLVENVLLVTIPRVLGFAFNPVSFWLCYDKKDNLITVLSEVNNTFGERHAYMCFHDKLLPISGSDFIERTKIFHVSPFCEIKGTYDFRFDIDAKKINIDINYKDENQMLITTAIRGKRKKLTDKNLLKYLFTYPFLTLKVVILIHYHALHLWLKKVPFFRKPTKPSIDIT